jgi:N utilization substance protein A
MSALAPAKDMEVRLNEEKKSAEVLVPDDQLSLAIGRDGQNVRLAAKLTGWKIDIRGKGLPPEDQKKTEESKPKADQPVAEKKDEVKPKVKTPVV